MFFKDCIISKYNYREIDSTRISEYPRGRSIASNFTSDRSILHEEFDPDPPAPNTKTVYIRQIDVTLNGNSIDQIADFQTQDQCMEQYFRLYNFSGQLNSLFSCGISYEDYR